MCPDGRLLLGYHSAVEQPVQDRRVLVVDDEQAFRDMLRCGLERHGFDVALASDARSARVSMEDHPPALALVDWRLPGVSGLDLLRWAKKSVETYHVPIIMLTGRTAEDDRVAALEAGADDYVVKPFALPQLVARMHAVLRRVPPNASARRIEMNGLVLDLASHRAMFGNQLVNLGPTDCKLLQLFMTHPERTYSREQLLTLIAGRKVEIEERSVDVQVRRLRRVLERLRCDCYVQTVRGAGYRFLTRAG